MWLALVNNTAVHIAVYTTFAKGVRDDSSYIKKTLAVCCVLLLLPLTDCRMDGRTWLAAVLKNRSLEQSSESRCWWKLIYGAVHNLVNAAEKCSALKNKPSRCTSRRRNQQSYHCSVMVPASETCALYFVIS